eukprot:134377_1
MSWQEDEEADKDDSHPMGWGEDKEDSDEWKITAQREIEDGAPEDDDRTDNLGDASNKKSKVYVPKVSKHYNLQSTEPLSDADGKWIFIKSLILWIYLVIISCGFIKNESNNTRQLIWFLAYILLLIFWCLFFRVTASTSRGGFYPIMGDWTQQMYHTTLFIFGLAGVDMYYLQRDKIIMRECIIQYKIVEFSILWFAYFISLSWGQYPWSQFIDEEYIHWSTNFNHKQWWELSHTIPVLLLLMDSIVHYSRVYHTQFWDHMANNNAIVSNLQYVAVLIILYIDTVVRGLLLLLFARVSVGLILLVLAAYLVYLILVWMNALRKSMDAPMQHFKIMMKKSGAKLIQAMLLSFWSVCGLFELLPTIKSASSDIQQQQLVQQKWGKNVIRLECFIRLLLSVVLFCKFWIMRNFKFEFEQKIVIYVVLIAFAVYPYALELLFQTPLSLLCRGSFFLVHHIDPLTSLPNQFRFNKDIHFTLSWKFGFVITNIRKLSELNEKYGIKCGDHTLTQFMQRIVFEMEENSSVQMKLYRCKEDRFLIVTAFPTEDEFKEFVESLSRIEITVLRPSDYDDEDKDNVRKQNTNDAADTEDADKANNDDFINPNAGAGGGYGNDNGGGGGNWFDDDDDDEEKQKSSGDKAQSRPRGSTLKILGTRKRKMSAFNKETANESLIMGLRVAGSFGSFCSFPHAMTLDKELQENDKKGYIERDEDKSNIVELKDFFDPECT